MFLIEKSPALPAKQGSLKRAANIYTRSKKIFLSCAQQQKIFRAEIRKKKRWSREKVEEMFRL